MARPRFSIRHQPGFTAIAATCFVLLYFPEGIVGTLKSRKRLPAFLDWG